MLEGRKCVLCRVRGPVGLFETDSIDSCMVHTTTPSLGLRNTSFSLSHAPFLCRLQLEVPVEGKHSIQITMKSAPRKAGKKKSSAAAATENEDAETLERLRLRFERELEAPILRALIPEEFATSERIRGPIMAPYPHDGTSKMRPARFVCIFDPKQPLPVESSIGKETQTPVLFFGEDHDKIYWVCYFYRLLL
jgi:hypothetical protein